MMVSGRPLRLPALAILAAAGLTARADWPQFGGPAGTFVAPATEKIAKSWPAEGPKVLWTASVAQGFSAPVIANNAVYIVDRVGTVDKFRALSLDDGKELFSLDLDSPPARDGGFPGDRGSPAIDGNTAYYIGISGNLYAIDLAAKKPLWTKNLSKDYGAKPGGWGYSTSPVVHGDKLLISAAGSSSAGIVALDKKTGETAWKSPAFGSADTYTTPAVVTLAGVEQVLMWHKGAIAGVSMDGKILWQFDWKTDRPIANPIVLPDDKVFISLGYGDKGGRTLLKIEKAGAKLEAKKLLQDGESRAKVGNGVFVNGHIFMNAQDSNGQSVEGEGLQCIAPDGKILWCTNGKPFFAHGQVLAADGAVLVMGGSDGVLRLVDASPAGYKELASAKILGEGGKQNIWAPMALSKGKLVARDQKAIKCLDVGAK